MYLPNASQLPVYHLKRQFDPMNYTIGVDYDARSEWLMFGNASENFTEFKTRVSEALLSRTELVASWELNANSVEVLAIAAA